MEIQQTPKVTLLFIRKATNYANQEIETLGLGVSSVLIFLSPLSKSFLGVKINTP
jgi:hypothetical protein